MKRIKFYIVLLLLLISTVCFAINEMDFDYWPSARHTTLRVQKFDMPDMMIYIQQEMLKERLASINIRFEDEGVGLDVVEKNGDEHSFYGYDLYDAIDQMVEQLNAIWYMQAVWQKLDGEKW